MQIRDGSSLLYDLDPIYVGINIGSIFGFVYEKPIDDYYLLKREGMYFGEKQLLVSVLKHPEHYYKIIAFDVTTNEDYNLSLDPHDVIELASTPGEPEDGPKDPPHLYEVLQNESEIGSIILESLVLVKKETQIILV